LRLATLGDIKAAVRAFSGDTNSVLFLDADLLRYTNYALKDIARTTRCLQGLLASTSGTLSAGEQYGGVLLPTDFLVDMDVWWGLPAVRLGRLPYVSFTGEFQQAAASQPTMYTISDHLVANGQRILSPYPWQPVGTTGQNYRIYYVSEHPAVAADGDTIKFPESLTEAIAFYVLRRCKIQEDDWQAAQALQSEIERVVRIFMNENNADRSDLQNFTIRDEMTPVYSVWEN